jgi:hypothetical protein
MKPGMTDTEYLQLLQDAMHANLTARVEYDKWQSTTQPPIKLEFMKLDDDDWTRLELEDIIKDPVRKALRWQLKRLGKQLYRALGSTRAMVPICQDVAARDPKRENLRSTIIDKTWDGIGNGSDIWVS